MTEIKEIHPESIEEWRKWLKENHLKETKARLVRNKKHTGKFYMANREAMDEAICFGWIDTTVKRIDEDTYYQNFSRRNGNSKWSKNTLSYAEELIKKGKMSKFGLKMYKEGKKKKPLDYDLPDNPDVPEELEKAFSKNKKAKENFYNFPPSTRRAYLRWILRAKRPGTITKRIKSVVELSEENKKNF